MESKNESGMVYLKDYISPDFDITTIDLTFWLDDTETIVESILSVNMTDGRDNKSLKLVGEEIELVTVYRDNKLLTENDYKIEDNYIEIFEMPKSSTIVIKTKIDPLNNTNLDGLYKSGEIFCTQNEPEGFRRITYYLDRPDIMAKFKTKIIADKTKYPVLLSNGNLVGRGDLAENKHWVEWEDPFKKPCYLFALVAGNLGLLEDEFITKSGRKVDLKIYCDQGNESKCDHAMESLKKSMKWDEERFGLEYDLDIYMIVAVDSFNMGAMENKGLNIFNSAYVLANAKTATDSDFNGIESVIGHEYFHNWTGNRITCRDWFQLTLKEGLTVFRDQEFSADLNSRSVCRIDDVRALRNSQFAEDEGPNAHSIKPSSYMQINNFYTATIYSKGAEVIRMLHTFLGESGFRKGMDKYFELFDGQAVTTEDFIHSMEVANDINFTQFKKSWYQFAGTPELIIESEYKEENKKYILKVRQNKNKVYHLPLKIALLDNNGTELPLILSDSSQFNSKQSYLNISKEQEDFVFENIEEMPIASLNRNFSAPIKINRKQSLEELTFLMKYDQDDFNRYEATQTLSKYFILDQYHNGDVDNFKLDPSYIDAFTYLLNDSKIENSFKAQCMQVPSENVLYQDLESVDTDKVYNLRKKFILMRTLSSFDQIQNIYNELNVSEDYSLDINAQGKRSLKNTCLALLCDTKEQQAYDLCYKQYLNANNMTDEFASFYHLIQSSNKYSTEVISSFYDKWKSDTLVIQKWLSAQSSVPEGDSIQRIKQLENSDVYDEKIPNLVRALIGPFFRNSVSFHAKDGSGYKFIREKIIEIDSVNPQMAAGLSKGFNLYKKINKENKSMIKKELEVILATPGLSRNVTEIISNTLNE